mgnify:CR=1 FL=1
MSFFIYVFYAGALAAALAKAATLANEHTVAVVYFPAGAYHIEGSFVVPDRVELQGAGAALTALYWAYDNVTTAPATLLSPAQPSARWAAANLTVYVLSLYHNIFHVPGDANETGQFRLTGVTVRADAFHCRDGMGGLGTRSAPWWIPGNATFGTLGGYQNTVVRLGALTNTSNWQAIGSYAPATSVVVQDCDISSSWHVFQGRAKYLHIRGTRIWNGGMPFYLIGRQVTTTTIINKKNSIEEEGKKRI